MIGALGHAEPADFSTWSRSCAGHMTRRGDLVAGGFDTARAHLRSITGGRCELRADRPSRFGDFSGTNVRLGDTCIHYWKWSADTGCQTTTSFPPNFHVVLHLPLRGAFEAVEGTRSAEAREGDMLVVSSAGRTVKRWEGSAEVMNIIVPRDALSRLLALEFGLAVDGPLELEPLASVPLGGLSTLTRYVETIVSDLNGALPQFADPQLAAQAERTLHLLLLKTIPHRYTAALEAPRSHLAPFYVKRAETYMRGHLQGEIGIEALADAAGVSARTLYYGFKRHRGMSPMKYLKHLRLTLAHQELMALRAGGGKVGDVAARCGYESLSQFSRDFRGCFGRSPAQVIRGAG